MELYRFYNIFETHGSLVNHASFISAYYNTFSYDDLAYFYSKMEDELIWRIGRKSDYLQEIMHILELLMLEKRSAKRLEHAD